MNKLIGLYLPAAICIVTILTLIIYGDTVKLLSAQMTGMNVVSYVVYVSILVIAIVVMPVTVMPIIPIATTVLGPLATALLSIVGWTVGGGIAFLLARYIGRPILERFVSMEGVDKLAARIPQDTRFLVIVLLRLTLPVDVTSYALGLSRVIGFWEYIVATLVGVIWFSFAFAYMGEALLDRNLVLIIEIGGASVVVFVAGWYLLKQKQSKK